MMKKMFLFVALSLWNCWLTKAFLPTATTRIAITTRTICSLAGRNEEAAADHHHHHYHHRSTTVIPISLLENSHWEDVRKPRRLYAPDGPPRSSDDDDEDNLGLPHRLFRHHAEWGMHDAATMDRPTVATVTASKRITHQEELPPTHVQKPQSTKPSLPPTPPPQAKRNADPVFPYKLNQVADGAAQAVCHKLDDENFQGRLSLEIDGAQHLQLPIAGGAMAAGTSATALRRLALVIAQKLAVLDDDNDDDEEEETPVVVYLNTIKQTMLAANDYREVMHMADHHAPQNITILTLGDDLPQSVHPPPETGKRKRSKRTDMELKYRRGFVVVVQPTDYNDEHEPPGPSIGTVEALQRLTVRASHMGLTTILISPRFLASPYYPTGAAMPSSWRQGDGTRQAASPFGGHEPARQPAPWLMRDFSPPVYSWIGHGISLSPPPVAFRDDNHEAISPLRRYTRVALLQSSVGAPWHVFGARHERGQPSTQVSYDYLASTAAQSGRPTRNIMRHIYQEFHE